LQTQTGHVDEAIGLYERAAVLLERDPLTFAPLAHAYAVAGRHAEARRVLERVEPLAREGRVRVNAITVVYAALGDLDSAFAWLERGIAVRDRAMVWNRVHPRLDALRGDPRFDRVLRAMKLV
jgi:Flp pilus assembly protein TadD